MRQLLFPLTRQNTAACLQSPGPGLESEAPDVLETTHPQHSPSPAHQAGAAGGGSLQEVWAALSEKQELREETQQVLLPCCQDYQDVLGLPPGPGRTPDITLYTLHFAHFTKIHGDFEISLSLLQRCWDIYGMRGVSCGYPAQCTKRWHRSEILHSAWKSMKLQN